MATARINMRINDEVKKRAEKVATLRGFSNLTAYLVKLMDDDSQEYLSAHRKMTLENDVFDRFIEACLNPSVPEPNDALKNAVKLARADGLIQ